MSVKWQCDIRSRGTTLEMIYPVSGLMIKRGGKPKARNMPGFASVFQEGEKSEEAEDEEDVEEAEAEDEEEEAAEKENAQDLGWALRGNNSQHKADENSTNAAAAETETRWVLGTNSDNSGGDTIERREEEQDRDGHGENFQQAFARNMRIVVTRRMGARASTGGVNVTSSAAEDDQTGQGENFQQTLARTIGAVATRRTGSRARKPTKFFDEAQTDRAANTMSGVYGRVTIPTGTGKRYASSINVRTLAMKGDKHRKEACGQTAGAVEWVLEFESRGLGIIALQECRIPSGMDGTEGEYRTCYSGSAEGKRQHGVGLHMHNRVTSGEFDIQPVSERIIWVYGSIYGVDQAVFSVYAPTNKKDNVAEVDKFYSTLEQQVNEVRKKYGPETKIIILGDFNARVGTDGADNMTEERNEADEVCANGTFGFEEADDNGAELLTFCMTKQFKVMDSYFARQDGEYGTWACNRSIDKGYHAALDHILVSKELWGEVAACGVHIPTV